MKDKKVYRLENEMNMIINEIRLINTKQGGEINEKSFKDEEIDDLSN